MQRSAGILLPISSLPSPYGIGCFSQEAYDFVDWLKEAGQTYWQILPLGVTSYGDSPYQSFSAFAGNPYFISLDALVEEGVLTADECKKTNFGRKADDINYSRLYTERGRLLRLAYSRSDIGHNEAFTAFCEKNKWWLDDFALFMAVKDRFEGKPWIEWAEDIRLRWQPAMDYYRRELYFEVEYHKYLQFKFDEQWRRLKAYANSKGIRIIGGWIDNIIMRIVDVFYCIPSMPVIIIIGAAMDAMRVDSWKRMMYLMLILGFLGWPSIARLVRGQILSLREQEFMLATEACGIKVWHRIFRHLIPNVIPQLIVTCTMGLGSTILTKATLSFLGLGVKYPFASWGNIINDVNNAYVMTNYLFIWIPAGVCLLLTVLGFNFVGDGLRDAFDPKMKR